MLKKLHMMASTNFLRTKCVIFDKVFSVSQGLDKVIEYEVVGDDDAEDFFMVNAAQGEISLKKDLMLDDKDEYKVCTMMVTSGK